VKPDADNVNRLIHAPNREIRVVGSLVIFVLAGGFAMLWPAVQHAVVERFGANFPAFTLVAELLVLVGLFVAYLWRKSCQVERLVRAVVDGRDRTLRLEDRFAHARSVLQASGELHVDEDAAASLVKVLQCVIDALHASRGVLFRQRSDNRPLEREAVYPSSPNAPDPLDLGFEDEIVRKAAALGSTLTVDDKTDLRPYGIAMPRPKRTPKKLVAVPLMVDGKAVGVLLLSDPQMAATADGGADSEGGKVEMFEICVGFAAGALRNLRKFQAVAKRNDELNRARNLLAEHQRELAEIDAVATMSRVARSLAHGLSGPLTAIAGYTDIVVTGKPDALTMQGAREGLRREIGALKKRLHHVVEFTQQWRRQYSRIDLNHVVETSVALQAESMRGRNITCRFEPHANLPFTVADPARLRQVFLSVLGFVRNTLATDRGPHDVRVRTLADAGRLRVHVEFRGKGAVKEVAAPLLDPNVEISTLSRERTIDLPVAVAIARDHQGDLQVEMLEDNTTRIVVDLPIQTEAPAVPEPPVGAEEGRSFDAVLAHIFADTPSAPRASPARPPIPMMRPLPASASSVPVPATRPIIATTSAAAAAAAAAAPAEAPSAATPEMEPALMPAGQPAPAAEPDGAGLDAIFHANEMWKGVPQPAKVEPPLAAKRATARRTLLDEAEVEGALKLFDDVASNAETPPAEEAPEG
jgi:hypothetical protein